MSRLLIIWIVVLFSCGEEEKKQNTEQYSDQHRFEIINPEVGLFNLFGRDKNGYQHGESNVTVQGNSYPINWIIYQSPIEKSFTISLPEKWNVKSQSNTFLYAKLNDIDNNFFIWKRYHKDSLNADLVEFGSIFYDIMVSDSIEVVEKSTVKEYDFSNDRTGLYFQFELKDTHKSYMTYSFLTEVENYIHEFSLKHTIGQENKLNEILFGSIIDNVYIGEQKMLPNNKPSITDIEIGLQ